MQCCGNNQVGDQEEEDRDGKEGTGMITSGEKSALRDNNKRLTPTLISDGTT